VRQVFRHLKPLAVPDYLLMFLKHLKIIRNYLPVLRNGTGGLFLCTGRHKQVVPECFCEPAQVRHF
jgi:hypothetical protein